MMVEVEGLSKRYGDLVAVKDASFRVDRGEVVGFLGPNGAGKTTTMRMVTGFLPPSSGSVRIAGHDILDAPLEARRAIGYLPESPPLYPEMRVADYLRYIASIKDVPRSERTDRVDRAIDACGLSDVRRQVCRTLSRGYRQRVGLAQAIVHDPEVLILDEPTAGLDPRQIVEIRNLIKRLAGEERRTVILCTHILPEVEAICRRVLLIREGQIRVDGTLEEVTATGSLEDVFLRESEAETETSSGTGAPSEDPQ
jgi:ABC-2 type transport system ATP-binding protein